MKIAKKSNHHQTLAQAIEARDEVIWRELSNITLMKAAEHFLGTLQGNTLRAYRAAFNSIFELLIKTKLLDPNCSLQTFSLSYLEYILDEIRSKIEGTEATKQARAATFIAFTRYLQRSTGGIIRKVTPNKEKGKPTFRKIRDTAATQALTKDQWAPFLSCLKRASYRDYLVAKTILQGAKRVAEVLTAQISQIDWATSQIRFRQLKSKEFEKFTVITYPTSFMTELKEYIGERTEGFIFVTRNGKPLTQPHIYRSFSLAGIQAGIPFIVHPHVLRASAITYLSSQGYHAEQIMRVSGHADAKLVKYYDKTPIEQNLTKDINLI